MTHAGSLVEDSDLGGNALGHEHATDHAGDKETKEDPDSDVDGLAGRQGVEVVVLESVKVRCNETTRALAAGSAASMRALELL